ncbi:pentatricopeptide repeat-containing protein At1g08070, chloroplastic-like [Tripterygium wilfordii]|uniref:pentatricopeptide repeat-containing protein At1g08070, chloroplastic-like n=1 Tax=Tripterygium wilfordii TaxID=458696 RepID=UPI0018F8555D|nr:pentatricopeptide repeat-containing protein At1g08070, chloroplastic-like [Tripterygium wilfordii]
MEAVAPALPAKATAAITTITHFPENPRRLILKHCKTTRDLNQIHSHLVKTGLHRNPTVTENLLECAAILLPTKTMDYALSIFGEIDEPDSLAYNVMLRAFTLRESPHQALILFKKMLEKAVQPDEFTFTCALKTCSKLRALSEGKQIHAHSVKCGLVSNCFVQNTLIRMYANCGSMEVARQVFDALPERDIVAWNSLFSGYSKNGCWENVVKLFREMLELDFKFDGVTLICVLTACGKLADVELGKWIDEYISANGLEGNLNLSTALVDMYAKCGQVETARRLFNQMDQRDVVAWSAMISGYNQARRCREALDLFKVTQMENVEPNEVLLASVISSCAVLGALETGKWVHLYVKKKRIELNVTLGTALMDFYAKCGEVEDLIEVFRRMRLKNVYSWTVLIQGLANNGEGKRALDYYYSMRAKNVLPNDVTFIAVLSACSHGGLVDEGRELFLSMSKDFGIEPRMEHYGCMVDILGRAGLIEEALQFIEDMSIQPNAVIWRTLLASCRPYKNVEIAEEAVNHLVRLEPMHGGDYILLSDVYASVGKWADATRVRNEMKAKGIKKTPGCSLIELDGEIFEIFSEHRVHPQSKEIYNATEKMMTSIKTAGYIPNTAVARLDAEEKDKETAVSHHSEKLAIAFALIKTHPGATIRISKNLRVCLDCHNAIKIISKVYNREIVVRDRNRFHHFKEGQCSCKDFW